METQPEITRRLLGSSAICHFEPDAGDVSVRLDTGGFIRRLLLFDTYILYSIRLKEIAEFVRHFGYQGTLTLLSSGALEIRCECAQFVEGQFSTPPCPPLTFQFHVIEAHIRDQYIIDCLSNVNRIAGLTSHQAMNLRTAVVKAIRQPDNRKMFSTFVAPGFEHDLLQSEALIKAAVRLAAQREKGIGRIDDFVLRFHKVGDDRYEAETNLMEVLKADVNDVHEILRRAALGISGLDQRIGEMDAHNALSGFAAEELPLFRTKLGSIFDAYGSHRQEKRFERVLSVAGLAKVLPDSQIDIERVLSIRGEPEAVEFRAWLADIDKLTDSELSQRVAGINARLGLAAQRPAGKALRFLVSAVAGFVSPLGLAGLALSVLDQFVWDMFCRRSGIAAVIHEFYPSIFVDPARK